MTTISSANSIYVNYLEHLVIGNIERTLLSADSVVTEHRVAVTLCFNASLIFCGEIVRFTVRVPLKQNKSALVVMKMPSR